MLLFSYVLAAGASALSASAFLIPLEVSEARAAASSQIEAWYAPESTVVELGCPGCLFGQGASYDDLPDSERHKPNVISLNVTVEAGNILKINEEAVFPLRAPATPVSIRAAQYAQDASSTELANVGFALEILPPVQFEREIGEIIPIRFTILDLDGHPVHVDSLQVDLLRAQVDDKDLSKSRLHIAKVAVIAYELTPGAAECETSTCRLRAIITARVRAMVAVAKAHAHKAKAWAKGACHGENHGKVAEAHGKEEDGTSPGRPHRHHKHHSHKHHVSHVFHQTLRFFVIPALLGVVGGLLASAVGMLVGQAVVFLWLRTFRSGHRGNVRTVEVAISDDEKDTLVENGELPPQYEDVAVVVVEGRKE